MEQIHTTTEVIEALGGTSAVAALTGRTYAAAFNWRSAVKFPANTYIALSRALEDKNLKAPTSLWGM